MLEYPNSLPEPLLRTLRIYKPTTFVKDSLFGSGRKVPVTNETVDVTFNFTQTELDLFLEWKNNTLKNVNEFVVNWEMYSDYVVRFISDPIISKLSPDIYDVSMKIIVVRKHYREEDMMLVSSGGNINFYDGDVYEYQINDNNKVTVFGNTTINTNENDIVRVYFNDMITAFRLTNSSIKEANLYRTKNITNMSGFFACPPIETVNITADTSNVTNMSYMFAYCANLTSINDFSATGTLSCYRMFYGCNKLVTAPRLNTVNCTTFTEMYSQCTELQTIQELNTTSIASNIVRLTRGSDKIVKPTVQEISLLETVPGHHYIAP